MRHLIILLLILWAGSSSGRRTKRDVVCRDGTGYVHNGICCLNCPAGTFVKEACSREFERGVCQQCEFDTYTEYDNGIFPSCLKCTKCRPDQELVEQCNSTRNTRCQCKAGYFCLPDQACEICKLCRKCKEGEETVKSCTAHSNTICGKRGSVSTGALKAAVVSVMSIVMMIMIVGCILFWRKSVGCKKAVASRWPSGMWKTCIENETLPKVVPTDGDDSLRKSFDLFAEIDVNFHNRFFRLIGLNDNAIKTADMSWSSPEDRVYELLKMWMEKEGTKADFNRLIEALLSLNQRLSAENITAKAIEWGYFRYKD